MQQNTQNPLDSNLQFEEVEQKPSQAQPQQVAASAPPAQTTAPATPVAAAAQQVSPTQTQTVTQQAVAPQAAVQAPQTKALEPKVTTQPLNMSHSNVAYQGKKPVVLLILDGWGIGPKHEGNAILKAKTPTLDKLWMSFPHTQLEASGKSVGLPNQVDGNSETGHLNIGAGSIIYQNLPRIDNSVADGTFDNNEAFHRAFDHVRQYNSTLHIMGLVSSGLVHSNIDHLYALLHLCKKNAIRKVYLHCFTDGRDAPPDTGKTVIDQLELKCKQLGVGEIASITGRFYAMDRDKRWERIERAYHALVLGCDRCYKDTEAVFDEQYANDASDETIEPTNICDPDGTMRLVKDNDAVIFFNFRIDRPRELTRAFVMPDFEQGTKQEDYDPHFEKYYKTHLHQEKIKETKTFVRKKIVKNLYFVTMTTYDSTIPVDVAFPMQDIRNNVGSVLANYGLRQLRVTESEKERMITYYMNGQRKQPYPGETWSIYPSKGAKSYAEVPEMSAFEIAENIVKVVSNDSYDVIISNIANGDMVGHTGDLQAAIKACEIVDKVVKMISNVVLAKDGILLITADHGNVEEMINTATNDPDTEHSIYPVPLMIIDKKFINNPKTLRSGILADIVPTMLNLMGLKKPDDMMGRALI